MFEDVSLAGRRRGWVGQADLQHQVGSRRRRTDNGSIARTGGRLHVPQNELLGDEDDADERKAGHPDQEHEPQPEA